MFKLYEQSKCFYIDIKIATCYNLNTFDTHVFILMNVKH
jgi:hypothetical protein